MKNAFSIEKSEIFKVKKVRNKPLMIVDAVRLGEVDEYSLRQLPPQLQQKILHAPYEQH